jgi:hypothetical protein
MFLRDKILLIIVLPMLLLAAYQFYSVNHVFNAVGEVRAKIFVESAKEVKYASDVQFLTSLVNSTLFELHIAFESKDLSSFEHALVLYRETQQQRFFALQKLKETLAENEKNSFEFIAILDEYRLSELTHIEQKISELDEKNEQIISIISRSWDSNSGLEDFALLLRESNELTREIVGELSTFSNKRFIKVGEASQLVEESENDARATLLMISALGYLLAGLLILFFHVLVLRPLERFARAIEKGSVENIAWSSLEPYRADEIGEVYRALEKCFTSHAIKNTEKSRLKKEKKARNKTSSPRKNGRGNERN